MSNLIQAAEIYSKSRDLEDSVSSIFWDVDPEFKDIVKNPKTKIILDISNFFNFKDKIGPNNPPKNPFTSNLVEFRSFKKLKYHSFNSLTQTGYAMVDLRINTPFRKDYNVGFMIANFKDGEPLYSDCNIVLAKEEKIRDGNTGYKDFVTSYGFDTKKIIMQYRGPFNAFGSARIDYYDDKSKHTMELYCTVKFDFLIYGDFFVNKTLHPYRYYTSGITVFRNYDGTMSYNNIPITGSDLEVFNRIDKAAYGKREDLLTKIKADKLAAENAEKERLAKIEADKKAAEEKAEKERLAKIEADKKAAEETAEKERLAKIEADKKAAEETAEKERLAKIEADKKAAAEKAKKERLVKIEEWTKKLAAENAENKQKAAEETAEKERLAKIEADKIEADKKAAEEKAEKERLVKIEADKIEADKKADKEAEKKRRVDIEADKKAAEEKERLDKKVDELYKVYNNYFKSTQYKDTTDLITKEDFSKKIYDSLTKTYFVNSRSWKSTFENWMNERNTECERTIKEHLADCMKDLGYKDSDIFAKYVQYTSQGHRSPLLFNLTPNTNWPSKPEAFFDNISNNIIKDKIWEVLSASRFTPNSTGKTTFLKNVTKDNKNRCIRYEYYKKFIEARDKKCIDVIVSGLKSSADRLKSQYPNYTLPTDTNKMVELYLHYCGGNKVPFQETFNEIKNYTTVINAVNEREYSFFDDVFKHIAAGKMSGETNGNNAPVNNTSTDWNTYNPIGYMSENPIKTAAAVGALGVGVWAYNKYRNRSTKKQDRSSKNMRDRSSKSKNMRDRSSKSKNMRDSSSKSMRDSSSKSMRDSSSKSMRDSSSEEKSNRIKSNSGGSKLKKGKSGSKKPIFYYTDRKKNKTKRS